MPTRMILITAAVVVLVLAVAGISLADSPTPSEQPAGTENPTATESVPPAPSASPVPAGDATYDAGDAGTVTIAEDGGVLSIVETTPADGWTSHVDDGQGRDVEVDFFAGAREIDFDAELHDGQILVRVSDEVDDDRDDRWDDRDDRDDRDDCDDDRDDDHDD